MFRLIESFENINNIPNWIMMNTTNYPIEGRYGNAMVMTTNGSGFFVNVIKLPSMMTEGTLNVALDLINETNYISLVFYDETLEQYRITLNGKGNVRIYGFGKEIAKTGSVFRGNIWNGFEICFKDNSLTIAVNGRSVLMTKNIHMTFDRIAFALPDNQPSGVRIDDLAFNDEGVLTGDKIVYVNHASLPYIPITIFSVEDTNGIKDSNPNGLSWSIKDDIIGKTVLMSVNRASTITHFSIVQ